jgi:DNA repair protein RadC
MQTMMVKNGSRYREATPAEIAEVAGAYALAELNRTRPTFMGPSDVANYLTQIYTGRDYETFAVLFFDVRHRLIDCVEMFRGTVDRASVHPREVAKLSLWKGAAAAVLAHNHPSGVAQPSNADLAITKRLRAALALLDVAVLDHLIVGSGGAWYSMAEHGEV